MYVNEAYHSASIFRPLYFNFPFFLAYYHKSYLEFLITRNVIQTINPISNTSLFENFPKCSLPLNSLLQPQQTTDAKYNGIVRF